MEITPNELREFWPDGFDVGEVAGVCSRAAATISKAAIDIGILLSVIDELREATGEDVCEADRVMVLDIKVEYAALAARERTQAVKNVTDSDGNEELPNCVWRNAATPFADNH